MEIQELIDQALMPKEEHKSSGKISPSSMGQCYRRIYWKRNQEPESNPIDNRVRRVFKAGNLFHDFVQNVILNSFKGWEKEVICSDDDVMGYADLVNRELGEVADIKSQHSRKFWYNNKEIEQGKNIRDMFYNNWLQIFTYCYILNLKSGRIVFVSKDDLCIQEYALPFDCYWQDEVDKEIKAIKSLKELPEAKPRLYNGKECEYCQYKDKCKGVK